MAVWYAAHSPGSGYSTTSPVSVPLSDPRVGPNKRETSTPRSTSSLRTSARRWGLMAASLSSMPDSVVMEQSGDGARRQVADQVDDLAGLPAVVAGAVDLLAQCRHCHGVQ